MCCINLRNPVVIRLVTCAVLMISDLDFVFGSLFISNLYQWGNGSAKQEIFPCCCSWLDRQECPAVSCDQSASTTLPADGITNSTSMCPEEERIFYVLTAAVIVGVASYFAAVCFFGPWNKYKVVVLLKDMMETNKKQFEYEPGKFVNESTPLEKRNPRSDSFKSLENTDEGRAAMRAGLSEYNLLQMWVVAEAKIAKNVCEMAHGIPFFRLSNFGFVAEPQPRDLAGILNANAVWTFAVGVQQIAYSVWIIVREHNEIGKLNVMTVLPFGISCASLVLSALNLALDFSKILTDLDEEVQLRDRILAASQGELDNDRTRLQADLQSDIEAIKRRITGTDAQSLLELEREMDARNQRYDLDFYRLDQNNIGRVISALQLHRTRVASIRAALTNKPPKNSKKQVPDGNVQRVLDIERDWDERIRKVEAESRSKIDSLDDAGENYVDECKRHQDECTDKCNRLRAIKQEQLDALKGAASRV